MFTGKTGLAASAIVLASVGTIVVLGQFTGNSDASVNAAESPVSTAANGQAITVYKSPSCGCCQSWVEHLETHGFQTDVVNTNAVSDIKQEHGVPRQLGSCHTAVIDGHVIEGHVPAADVLAYVRNPVFEYGGLSVPGMPQGSPGMETGRVDDYQVVAFNDQYQFRVFREYTD